MTSVVSDGALKSILTHPEDEVGLSCSSEGVLMRKTTEQMMMMVAMTIMMMMMIIIIIPRQYFESYRLRHKAVCESSLGSSKWK